MHIQSLHLQQNRRTQAAYGDAQREPAVIERAAPEQRCESNEDALASEASLRRAKSLPPPNSYVSAPVIHPLEVIKRTEALLRLKEVMKGVPGNSPEDIENFTQLLDEKLPIDLRPLIGKNLTSREWIRRLGLEHPTVELRAENTIVTMSPGFYDHAETAASVVGLFTDKTDSTCVGYFWEALWKPVGGRTRSYLNLLYLDPNARETTRGLAAAFLNASERLAVDLGIEIQDLEAGHVGRYFWAVQGYDFDLAMQSKALEQFKTALSSFLEKYNISEEELAFDRGEGASEPFAWDKLQHSWDFAQLVSLKQRPLVTIEVGRGDLREERLAVGKGFMMDRDTPGWLGFRPTDQSSPGQRQHQRALKK